MELFASKRTPTLEVQHPAPIIVGVPRSGTTLLRLMLDAHSQLAIPPETGFVADLATRNFSRLLSRTTHRLAKLLPGRAGTGVSPLETFYLAITESPAWVDFRLDKREFKESLLHSDASATLSPSVTKLQWKIITSMRIGDWRSMRRGSPQTEAC